MSITFSTTKTVKASSGAASLTGTTGDTGGTVLVIDESLAASTTNSPVTIAFAVAGLQQFVLLSDQDVTIKTNSTGSPANTLNLKAGLPFFWSRSESYYANPFTTDVTAMYITTTAASRVQGRFLVS